jgi:hypothetical protein
VSVRREAMVVAILTIISALAVVAAFGLLTNFQAQPIQPPDGIRVSTRPVTEVAVVQDCDATAIRRRTVIEPVAQTWSGRGESNPHRELGKLEFCH